MTGNFIQDRFQKLFKLQKFIQIKKILSIEKPEQYQIRHRLIKIKFQK